MNLVYENENRLIKTCFTIESRGVLLDLDYVRDALAYEHEKLYEAKKDFEKDTGRAYIDSSKLFAEIFDERGERYPRTDKGNPSFAADALETIDTPTTRLITRIRDHEKRAGTYYSSFLYYADKGGRLHANIRTAGTKTGRFSYANPNLQNIPKEDEESDLEKKFVVRGSFIPSPGFSFVSLDYSQVEYRLMLDYAGETGLIKRVLGGEDVHQATADMVGISRKQAKTLNFAILYGAGIDLLAHNLGIKVREADDLRRKYFSRLPKVKAFLKKVMSVGEARGHVVNWMGRRCHINHRDFSYTLPNHLIQGGAADVIKVAMNRIHEFLEGKLSGMVVQIHDDILHEIHDDEHDLVPGIQKIMESVYEPRNGMRLTVKPEISTKSWAYRDFEEFTL